MQIIFHYLSYKYHKINKRKQKLYFRQTLSDGLICIYDRKKKSDSIKDSNESNRFYRKIFNYKCINFENSKKKNIKED